MSRLYSQPDDLIPPHLRGLTPTPKQLERLSSQYRDLRLELASTGELIVRPPIDTKTGMISAKLLHQLGSWAKNNAGGVGFSSKAGFHLPNGAIRAASASWMRLEKWDGLTDSQKEGFAPLCPDFVIELRSNLDDLPSLVEKMEEYMANGTSLGWLIDPKKRRVYVYRAGEEVVVLEDPATVSGEPLLHGFELQMNEIW